MRTKRVSRRSRAGKTNERRSRTLPGNCTRTCSSGGKPLNQRPGVGRRGRSRPTAGCGHRVRVEQDNLCERDELPLTVGDGDDGPRAHLDAGVWRAALWSRHGQSRPKPCDLTTFHPLLSRGSDLDDLGARLVHRDQLRHVQRRPGLPIRFCRPSLSCLGSGARVTTKSILSVLISTPARRAQRRALASSV